MSQAAIFEAKKLLRREIKKRLSAMSAESKARESKLICEKVSFEICTHSQWNNDKNMVTMLVVSKILRLYEKS